MTRSVSGYVTARVGYSGTKVHVLMVTVQRTSPSHPTRPGELAVYYGSVQCGSRRRGSGQGLTGLDLTKVTCERCALNFRPSDYETSGFRVVSDASTIVAPTGRFGALEPVDPFPFDIEEATR